MENWTEISLTDLTIFSKGAGLMEVFEQQDKCFMHETPEWKLLTKLVVLKE